ncbi:glucosyl-3-phosphoglycerate synthase [Actinophytocola algeriensis]|uniref:Glucosyl-3-phosphoglycerate synthase n=1 Tax=Actinophytocola algeriensis TaxID=1768010 RepID=A0A7W7QBL3_9PSEU|nr:glucosyl-3-phosphoglycerate synthase [Actinophytocola algeriensis]MBB4910641.1 glucosyl-3-phosphoglycerate synthase [Actinophytocola algeriensis]MBE1473634.1 glucosyl-3-phosphoglycerate synthase [Actinophytocola algeriensis]
MTAVELDVEPPVRQEILAWLRRRTSSVRDWPLPTLVAAKGSTRISVVLPALDEQATVGTLVRVIRDQLVDRHGLVDELVVMDSGSTDDTAAVARAAGARVVHREEVLPGFDPLPGKGEVLWRSVAATTGDIVVFVDSDLYDFDPAFVTGLVGPLLRDPKVQFVKAAYNRPLRTGGSTEPHGGGRVTEILVRPLINVFWPELAGFVQPLAGEYAVRRSVLERLPFSTGYGVELGLLVDALRAVGLDGLAQVDLVERKHRNSGIGRLGRMAGEIVQVALARAAQDGRLTLHGALPAELVQFARDGEVFLPTRANVAAAERPPMITVTTSGATR